MASAISSGLKSADAVISNTVNRVNSLTVLSDGTNVATVILYDNPSAASGTVLAKVICAAGTRTAHAVFENPVKASTGIYADVSGTGAEYIVTYGG